MANDLALNRVDHDMVWHSLPYTPIYNTIWDNETTVWDHRRTGWDIDSSTIQKFEIWSINGADKVAQQIKINLLTLLGEWFLDNTWGVPYLEEILVKNPHMASVETILRAHISSVPNVLRISSLGLNWHRQERTLYVEFACDTDLGPIKESVKLEVFPRV